MHELFNLHNPSLANYLRRLLGRDDVADRQQETWLSVLRSISCLKDPEAFLVWFYTIARSKAFTPAAGGRSPAAFDTDASESAASPPEESLAAPDAQHISAGLDRLSTEHREVIVLRFMQDLSYEQIAAIVGCTTGTIRSRLHYAKLALRPHLDAHLEPRP